MATALNTFDYIPEGQRIMYESAFNAITQLELWPFIKNFQGESFMFSNAPEVDRIYKRIEELGYSGHSGGTFGCIMRTMEFIAKNGLENFEREYRTSMERSREQPRNERPHNREITHVPQ